MEVFAHHLYEYGRGLRRLVLHTTRSEYRGAITARLVEKNISYIITNVTSKKINIFFGAPYCIEVLNTFPHLNLKDLPPDKDFILGAMLGYDMKIHCRRYLGIIEPEKKNRLKAI